MPLFSQKKSAPKAPEGVPPQIFSAVSVMGDELRPDAIEAAPVSSQPAPFSAAAPQDKKEAAAPAPETLPVLPEEKPKEGSEPSPFGAPAQVPPTGPQKMNPLSFRKGAPRAAFPKLSPKWLIGGGIGLVAILLVAGILLFTLRSQGDKAAENSQETLPVPDPASQEAEKAPAALPPFALDKPNYLSFNTETDNAASIQERIREAGAKIVAANVVSPVEFVITDQNNNPLAFSRFAYLAELPLPADLVAALDEKSVLYVYNDGQASRYGFRLSFREGTDAVGILEREASALPAGFAPLFYGSEEAVPQKASFRSGTYKDLPVQYTNVSTEKNLSFDYAVDGAKLFVGNSKNVLRIVLDKEKMP